MDVRINPEHTTVTVAGSVVQVFSLLLGGVPRGAAAVINGRDGLDEADTYDTMNRLAEQGYESILVRPAEKSATGPLSAELGRALVDHLLDRLAARGWTSEQIGLLGYGAGARPVLVAGSEQTYGAAVSVPRAASDLLRPEPVKRLRTPWLGLVGIGPTADLSPELADYRDAVRALSTEHSSLIPYRGVPHCLQDSTEVLVHAAAFDSWQRTAEWLNIHVAPRPTPAAEAWRERRASARTTH